MVFWSNFIKKIKNAVSKERVDKLEQKINTNATNIELLEQDVDTNTNSISDIKNNITSINSNINDLDNDVTRIENSLTSTNNELDSLEARVNGYDDRINEANNKANEANTKATQAEEQATRLGSTVSTNTTKITALETKDVELTNRIDAIPNLKKMTFDFSQMYLRVPLQNKTLFGFKNYSYQLNIDYKRVVAMVPVIIGGTRPEYVICAPKIYDNNIIEIPFISVADATGFQIGGHLIIYYI